MISAFEMMVHELVQNSFINDSKNPKFMSVGYYHSLMSKDFLGYYLQREIQILEYSQNI